MALQFNLFRRISNKKGDGGFQHNPFGRAGCEIMLLFIVCVLQLLFCLSGEGNAQNPGQIEEEDYKVYSAVIRSIPLRVTGTPTLIDNVIFRYPIFGETPAETSSWKSLFTKVRGETLQDFGGKNQSRQQEFLKAEFKLNRKYILLDKPFESLPKGLVYQRNRAKTLLNQHKGAKLFLRLSRVGFNKERTQAFLFYVLKTGEGSDITSVFLEKRKGRWVITQEEGRVTS